MIQQVPYYVAMPFNASPSFQSAYLFNSLVPSVVYEPQMTATPYSTLIPINGYQARPAVNNCVRCDCTERNKAELDADIDRRVKQQINKYNSELAVQSCPSCCSDCCTSCNSKKNCVKQQLETVHTLVDHDPLNTTCCQPMKSLNLDEKIDLIRKELNMPSEKEEKKLIAKLNKEVQKAEFNDAMFSPPERIYSDDKVEEVERKSRRPRSTEPGCPRFRSRSKSFDDRLKTSIDRSKSRSASRGRRMWLPTGANDYTATNFHRNQLISEQDNREKRCVTPEPKPNVVSKHLRIFISFHYLIVWMLAVL